MGKLNRPKIEVVYCACGPDCKIVMKPGQTYAHGHNGRGSHNGGPKKKIVEPIEARLCECNCGEYAKPGNRFILGHSLKNRVPWNKDLKDCFSDETVKAMSDAKMGLRGEEANRYRTKTSVQGLENMSAGAIKRVERDGAPMLGKHHTEETIEVLKIKASNPSDEARYNMSIGQLNRIRPPALVWLPMQLCECGCMKWPEPGNKYIHGHHARDREWTPEAREATRAKTQEDWVNYTDEERNARVSSWAKSQQLHPNKPESVVLSILDQLYPGEYKYTGDGKVIIAGKMPDFINCNGQKKIIELFGDYWHKGEDPKDRAEIFAPYGYDTLVIWEHELQNIEEVKSRIHRFHASKHNEISAIGGA